jgi:hypothetical protein
MAKKPSTMSVSSMEEEDDARFIKYLKERYKKDVDREAATGVPAGGLPAVVRTNGKVDPAATGKLSGANFDDAIAEKYGNRKSARDRAKKNYNVPAQITDEDRRKAKEETARANREMGTESDISKDDKKALKELLEGDDETPKPFRKGGMVKKSSKSGSGRGDGCAVRGRTKGKMY